jgi:hypothetical protein
VKQELCIKEEHRDHFEEDKDTVDDEDEYVNEV